MDQTINAADLAELSVTQKKAVLQALFLTVGIDRVVEAEESSQFNREVAQIPWGVEPRELQQVLRAAAARRKVSQAAENIAWIHEIAAQLPSPELREKVLATMGRIAMAGQLNDAERGLLSAAALAFEVPEERMNVIRQSLLSQGT